MNSFYCAPTLHYLCSEMKRTSLLLIISVFCALSLKAQRTDSIRISLLTCASGSEIYSLFGHTAIRYENFTQGIDAVFNYGMFNFNAPNFIFRFALGETDYQLGVTSYEASPRNTITWDGTSGNRPSISPKTKKCAWQDCYKRTTVPKTACTATTSSMTTAPPVRATR